METDHRRDPALITLMIILIRRTSTNVTVMCLGPLLADEGRLTPRDPRRPGLIIIVIIIVIVTTTIMIITITINIIIMVMVCVLCVHYLYHHNCYYQY